MIQQTKQGQVYIYIKTLQTHIRTQTKYWYSAASQVVIFKFYVFCLKAGKPLR